MRFLITNDDGIYSPGIATLADVAQRFGEARIVAPDVEMSSAGQSITASRPLTYKRTTLPHAEAALELEAYRVNGTPADCVALGIHGWEKVDIVLSGINIGSNIGNSAWHSGTLAGAKQAVLFGLRGIAFSAPASEDNRHFQTLKPWVTEVLQRLIDIPGWTLLNVNFPKGVPKGVTWCSQSVRHYDGKVVPGKDPMGRSHFWFTVIPVEETDQGTDRYAVERGYVAITPLRMDITDHAELESLRATQPLDAVRFSIAEPIPASER